ncbi:hemerythrin domain-containing protein [Streptomyces sp. NPDC002573]|uniref:hemerythrin domain-containing protein n=1 Tax=Streptomyces sp. NPDC002573 TaxID=3364651 RepID=UPI00367E4118
MTGAGVDPGAAPPGATPAGEAMVRTLVAAHGKLRHDLSSLQEALRMVAAADARSVPEVRGIIDGLSMHQAAWQLRSFCETYCQVVHAHHSIEDFRIFPAVLRTAPELAPIVERLTSDHAELGRLLDVLVAAVETLAGPQPSWTASQDSIGVLAERLAAHLDLEEEHILPALGRLPDWV